MPPVKVVFLSRQNYLDKTIFSGTLYYMRTALIARGMQVIDLGNPRKPSRWRKFFNRVTKSNDPGKLGSPRYIAEHIKFASLIKKQLI